MRKVRVKPSKFQSLVGMIAGSLFVILGIGYLIRFGLFGVIWTLVAFAITGMHAYNFFNYSGVASWEIDVEADTRKLLPVNDFEEKLRKLNRLKEDGLITEREFERKRAEIMNSNW